FLLLFYIQAQEVIRYRHVTRVQKCALPIYLAFLDDDDKYLPDKLEKQIPFIQKYRLDGCYHDVNWFNEKEKQVEYRTMDYTQDRSEEHTSELQSRFDLVCRLLLEKKKPKTV